MAGEPYDAIVLAGGSASRLGGVDKPLLQVGGRSMLDGVLDAVANARRVVVVGPQRAVRVPVTWTREEPPGGGPVAALAAGLRLVESPVTVLLAADLPFARAAHVRRLLEELGEAAGVLLVDEDGRDQPLFSAWRTQALLPVVSGDVSGWGLSRTLRVLRPRRLTGGVETRDCDTADDVERARRLAHEGEANG